jgi:nucleotidyltransferase/DNA polymerase involved in DNA repair
LLANADAFFAAVARSVDPEGAGTAKYLIVGGTHESRGVVCSASWEARQFGVRSAMSIAQALALRLMDYSVSDPSRLGAGQAPLIAYGPFDGASAFNSLRRCLSS